MTNEPRPRAAVLTVSDAGSRGERVDTAGPACVELLRGAGFDVAFTSVVPDEPEAITEHLRRWADAERVAVVVTTVSMPPMSFAIRLCTSPVRVRVKKASERRCRCR